MSRLLASSLPEDLHSGGSYSIKHPIYQNLSWFYHNFAYNPAAITQEDINEYVSHYSAPGDMHAGFEYYRAFPQLEILVAAKNRKWCHQLREQRQRDIDIKKSSNI